MPHPNKLNFPLNTQRQMASQTSLTHCARSRALRSASAALNGHMSIMSIVNTLASGSSMKVNERMHCLLEQDRCLLESAAELVAVDVAAFEIIAQAKDSFSKDSMFTSPHKRRINDTASGFFIRMASKFVKNPSLCGGVCLSEGTIKLFDDLVTANDEAYLAQIGVVISPKKTYSSENGPTPQSWDSVDILSDQSTTRKLSYQNFHYTI
jgi:hypothetical protein